MGVDAGSEGPGWVDVAPVRVVCGKDVCSCGGGPVVSGWVGGATAGVGGNGDSSVAGWVLLY